MASFDFLKRNIYPDMDKFPGEGDMDEEDIPDQTEEIVFTASEEPEEEADGQTLKEMLKEETKEPIGQGSGALRGNDPGKEEIASCSTEVRKPEEVLLNNWPLDMLTESKKGYGIIPMLEDQKCLDIYRKTGSMALEELYRLKFSEDKLLQIGVAMLWGWLPAYVVCYRCSSPMKLVESNDAGIDPVKWTCTREVPHKQYAKKSLKENRAQRCPI